MRILVIHPRFSLLGGGELLCLQTLKAIRELGHEVTIASSDIDPVSCERIYGSIAQVLYECDLLPLPKFKALIPRFMAYQRLKFAGRLREDFLKAKPDLVVSTQSSIYYLPRIPTIHFIYDIVDLSVIKFVSSFNDNIWKIPYYRLLRRYRDLLEKPEPSRKFVSLARNISKDLDTFGYENRFVFPPIPLSYEPLPKKNQIVQVTRTVPIKRLEEFCQMADLLPEYEFHVIGLTNEPHRNYRNNFVKSLPKNVNYHESPLREVSHVLRESKVYLYTSHEPGLPIAFAQGIGAGCFPVAPSTGGGMELIETTGLGFIYSDPLSGAKRIKRLMKSESVDPLWIRETIMGFSEEVYRENVKSILETA